MADTSYPNNAATYDPYDFNTKWSTQNVDQVYQFDNQPTNIIFAQNYLRGGVVAGTNYDFNDLYQLSYRLQRKQLKGYESWMNWIEKIQPDYKFLTVNETNAQTCVFANVDDPWMFTEYIFKGTGRYYDPATSGTSKFSDSTYLVIQPPLYTSTLGPDNGKASQYDALFCEGSSLASGETVFVKKVRDYGWYKNSSSFAKLYGDYFNSRYNSGADGSILYRGQICVQSVKWGQHGNVPPHAINMMAPKSYLQADTKLTLMAVNKTTYGFPSYLQDLAPSKYGVINIKYVNGDPKYYIKDMTFSGFGSGSSQLDGTINSLQYCTFTMPKDGSGTELVPSVKATHSGVLSGTSVKIRIISYGVTGGQIVVNGCKYFGYLGHFSDGDRAGCTLQKDMTTSQKQNAFCCSYCTGTSNSQCKYFVKRGKTVVYRYQAIYTDSDAQYGYQTVKTINQSTQYTENVQTTYEYVEQQLNGIQVYIPPNAKNNKGAKITRGTGQSAFQKAGLDARGIYDNDMSQINYHRWMCNILPCYNKQFCNQTVGKNNTQSTKYFTNSGISYLDFSDNNQIVNKTNPFCPYYKTSDAYSIGCPYSTVNKTAMDFAKVNYLLYQSFFITYANLIVTNILQNIKDGTITTPEWSNQIFLVQDLSSSISQGTGYIKLKVFHKTYDPNDKKLFPTQNYAVVYLSTNFGIQQSVLNLTANKQSKKYKIWDSSTKKLKQVEHDCYYLCSIRAKVQKYKIKEVKRAYNETNYALDVFFQYHFYGNGEYEKGKFTPPKVIGSWFCVMNKSSLPGRDPLIIDNQMKFVGGYHPQYLSWPASPDEIMYQKEVQKDTQDALQEKADTAYDQGTGNQSKLINTKSVQYGYFIKQNGQWILDGRKIGTPITKSNVSDSISYRALNPANQYLDGCSIFSKWSNSVTDPESDSGNSPKKIKNCVVFSNDTKQSIDYLRTSPPQLFDDSSDNKPRKIRVSIGTEYALPYERSDYTYCTSCSMVLAPRFYQYDFSQSANVCPFCGNSFTKKSKQNISNFPITKAIGRVVIWGLPGTIIKTDSYFWKSPPMVSAALLNQIQFKLGTANAAGGGYSNSRNSRSSQAYDHVPYMQDLGVYKMGSMSSISSGSTYVPYIVSYNKAMFNPNISSSVLSGLAGNTYNPNAKVIAPFDTSDTLKMVTADYITAFRNRLQPTLAYFLGNDATSGTGRTFASGQTVSNQSKNPTDTGQYQIYRVNYNDRKQLSYMKYWIKRKAKCKPLIIAYTGSGTGQTQCYITYSSGSVQTGMYLKYFPLDPHWWYNKQYIGGVYTTLTGHPYHFDHGTKFYKDDLNHYDGLKTGTSVLSQCYILPFGFLPGDKQVKAAYLYFNGSQQDTYVQAIGQIQMPSGIQRTSHMHFHGYATGHQTNGQNQDVENWTPHHHEIDNNLDYGQWTTNAQNLKIFKQKHNIIDRDDMNPSSQDNHKKLTSYFDKYGDQYYIDEISGLPIYHRKFRKKYPQYFIQPQDIHEFKWLQDRLPYTPLVQQVDMSLNATGINYTHQKKDFGQADIPDCIRWDGFGCDIYQTKSQNQIWKNYTTQQYKKMQDKYLSKVTVQIDAGDDNTQEFSFYQYYNNFSSVLLDQSQSIPGYFDLTSYNTSGRLKKYQDVYQNEDQVKGQYQQFIIKQSDNQVSNDTNAGTGDSVVDITSVFKSVYTSRVERHFVGNLGSRKLSDQIQSLNSKGENIKSVYQGTGTQSTERSNWSTDFDNRTRYTSSSVKYFVLNTNYWYPVLNSDGVMEKSTSGQKINFQLSKLSIAKKTHHFFTLPSTSSEVAIAVSLTVYGTSLSYNKTFSEPSSTSMIDSATLVSYINTTIQQTSSNLQGSNYITAQEVNGNIYIKYIQQSKNNSTFFATSLSITISGLNETLSWQTINPDCDRIISYTNYFNGCHPRKLNYYASGLNYSSINATSARSSWECSVSKPIIQYVVMDLIQPPLQLSRRNYLSVKGGTSYDQCTCSDTTCKAYGIQNNIYAKTKGVTATNVCSQCQKEFSSPKSTPGDGINTNWYDDPYEDSVIVAGVVIKPSTGGTTTKAYAPISLFLSDDNKNWKCILSLIPTLDGSTHKYTYHGSYVNSSDNVTFDATTDTDINFLQVDTSSGSYNGVLNKGRYLKIATCPAYYITTVTDGSYTQKSQYVTFSSLSSSVSVADGDLINSTVKITTTLNGKSIVYLKNIINNVGNYMYIDPITFEKDETFSSAVLYAKLYYSQVASIKVYGGGYHKDKLLFTPSANQYTGTYSKHVQLGCLPIQFFKVSGIVYDYLQYPYTQIMSYSDVQQVGYELMVVSEKYYVIKRNDNGEAVSPLTYVEKTIKYYAIKGGKYYFDLGKRRIFMPFYGFSNENIMQVSFGHTGAASQTVDDDLQYDSAQQVTVQTDPQEPIDPQNPPEPNIVYTYKFASNEFCRNLEKWGVAKDLTPTKYFVKVWDGTQGGVDVQVSAVQKGPSYQLQRGAICCITTALPSNGSSTPLVDPSNSDSYTSYESINSGATQREIPWIVYNKQISTIDQTAYGVNKGNFFISTPSVLQGTSAQYWEKNIIGSNAVNYTSICKATVTLKGKPDTCLTGSLQVYAPDVHQSSINGVTIYQRTGGFKKGIAVKPKITGTQRATNAYTAPFILVYLKQRLQETALQ